MHFNGFASIFQQGRRKQNRRRDESLREPTKEKAEGRPKVLLFAYACSPYKGSEPGIGWNRAIQTAKRFDTWVVCEEGEFSPDVRQYLKTHGTIPGLEFIFVKERPWESHLWRFPGLGYLAYNLWHRRAFRVARRLHEQVGFDLAHQVTFIGYREPGYLWKLGVPFVWGPVGSAQNFPWRFLAGAGFRGAIVETLRSMINTLQLRFSSRIRRAARRSAVLLAANTENRDALKRAYGVTPQVLPDTGMNHLAKTDETRRPDDDRLRILWAGLLLPRKALYLLIEAVAKLPAHVDCEVRVLGEGPERSKLEKLCRRRKVEQQITLMGNVPHEEALAQFNWADVFAFTSVRDTTGTVVLEALGAGLPVIAFDHQGVGDAVDESCGIKIPVSTPSQAIEQFAEAITSLAIDPDLRHRMSLAAIDRAGEYLWCRQAEKLAEVYNRILGQRNEPIPTEMSIAGPRRRRKTAVGRFVKDQVALSSAKALRFAFGPRQRQGMGILMYHRVAETVKGMPLPTWNVTPRNFSRQMQGLISRGYQAWPLRKVLEHQRAGRPVPQNVFVVTFDDGYECIHRHAWPVLKELNIPATVFVATAFLDRAEPFPFDDWDAAGSESVPAESWLPLTTEQCREMMNDGLIEIGLHTHTHKDFRGQTDEFRADMLSAMEVLDKRLGISEATFAFPFGYTTPALKREVESLGLLCSLTTEYRLADPSGSPFDWGRVTAFDSDSAASIAAKLDGWYFHLRGVWQRLKKPALCQDKADGRSKRSVASVK